MLFFIIKHLLMKHLLFSLLFIVVVTIGCSQLNKDNGELARKVEALEKKIDSIENQTGQLAVKARIASDFSFLDPWNRFLAESDAFWENPIDVTQVECSKRCTKILQGENTACFKIADDVARQKCLKDASDRAAKCHTDCAKH